MKGLKVRVCTENRWVGGGWGDNFLATGAIQNVGIEPVDIPVLDFSGSRVGAVQRLDREGNRIIATIDLDEGCEYTDFDPDLLRWRYKLEQIVRDEKIGIISAEISFLEISLVPAGVSFVEEQIVNDDTESRVLEASDEVIDLKLGQVVSIAGASFLVSGVSLDEDGDAFADLTRIKS